MNQKIYPYLPGFRKTDTSEAAAKAITPIARTLSEMVERCLRFHGAMTADECAQMLGKSLLSIRPRFSEFRKLGRIEDTGQRRRIHGSNNTAIVWRLC